MRLRACSWRVHGNTVYGGGTTSQLYISMGTFLDGNVQIVTVSSRAVQHTQIIKRQSLHGNELQKVTSNGVIVAYLEYQQASP